MTFTAEDLELLTNGSIYYEACGPLGQRIDFAWDVYSDNDNADNVDKYKKNALNFLIYAFDLTETSSINTQLLELMFERQKYRDENSDYIPSKQPQHLPFDPAYLDLQMMTTDVPDTIQQAIKSKELLDLQDMHKYIIDPKHTRYLDTDERASYRVHIRNGLFEHDGSPYDTASMESHGRVGYAAYTINANGELSVFTHLGGADGLYHSSMNAGAPVVSAGELKIQNGHLLEITTSSGHYNPTLFNVHRTLEYFSSHRIDITQVSVRTQSNPAKVINTMTSIPLHPGYLTPATQIYKSMNQLLSEAIETIASDLKQFNENPLNQFIGFHLSQWTRERMHLAQAFKNELDVFRQSLNHCSSPYLLEVKLLQLTGMVKKYEGIQTELAQQHHKREPHDRLTRTIVGFKERISQLKSESELDAPKTAPLTTKMKKIY